MGKTVAVKTKMKDVSILKAALAEFYKIPVEHIETVHDLIQKVNDANKGKAGWVPVKGVEDYLARNKKDPTGYPLLTCQGYHKVSTDKGVLCIRNKNCHNEKGQSAQWGSDMAFDYNDSGTLTFKADDHLFGADTYENSFAENPEHGRNIMTEYLKKEVDLKLKKEGIVLKNSTGWKKVPAGVDADGQPKFKLVMEAYVDADALTGSHGPASGSGFKAAPPQGGGFKAAPPQGGGFKAPGKVK